MEVEGGWKIDKVSKYSPSQALPPNVVVVNRKRKRSDDENEDEDAVGKRRRIDRPLARVRSRDSRLRCTVATFARTNLAAALAVSSAL